MDIYRELILDHYKHPHNFGHLPRPDAKIEEGNVTCGDRIVIEIKTKGLPAQADKTMREKTIEEIKFSGEGCVISQASASLLTDKVKGMKTRDIMNMQTKDILAMLGTTLTPSRTKCAMLALEVLQKAIGLLK